MIQRRPDKWPPLLVSGDPRRFAIEFNQRDDSAGRIRPSSDRQGVMKAPIASELLDPRTRSFLERIASLPPSGADPRAMRARAREFEGAPAELLPPVSVARVSVQTSQGHSVHLSIVRPERATERLPVIMYLHGGGWLFGDEHTHAWPVTQLASLVPAAVVFVHFSLSPEARYPVALEESYSALEWLATNGGSVGLDADRIAIAGDSAGANMATVLGMLAPLRGGPRIQHQLLFYPLVDAEGAWPSTARYADGFYLTAAGLRHSLEQYVVNPRDAERYRYTVSPIRATDEELAVSPPALIITAELDPLRDQGEAYARRLAAVGVPVVATRYLGAIHAFLTVRALAGSDAPCAAIVQAASVVRTTLFDL
jgi:acetyl esterase